MVAIQRDEEMEHGSMYWNKGVRNKLIRLNMKTTHSIN